MNESNALTPIKKKPSKKRATLGSFPYTAVANHTFSREKKTGVVLMNMGGPDDQESVEPFLFNLFSDPDIIKLPMSFLFQKVLAGIIVKSRGKEAKKNYQKMGGGSPQLPITYKQGRAIKEQLLAQGLHCSVGIAMRYWHPFTEQTLEALRADGVEQLVLASLYPHFSYTTTGSNLNEIKRVLKRMHWDVPVTILGGYCQEEWYLNALADRIQEGLNIIDWTCPVEEVRVLFSAHSLPERHVKRTGDPYKQLIDQCATNVMEQYFPEHQWDMAYQSKVGKMPWIGPATEGVLSYYVGKGMDNILMVPISFVSDHVETLVEMDLDYMQWAREEGIQVVGRAPVMNTCPLFIEGFSRRILSQIEGRLPKGQSVLNAEDDIMADATVAVSF